MAKTILGFDSGHGGNDPGAVNGGRKESNDVLRLEKSVTSYILSHSSDVVIYHTRTGDTNPSLRERTNFLNAKKVKLAVSFHRDSSANKSACGATIRVQTGQINRGAGKLAKCIAKGLIKINKGNRADADGVIEQNLHMTRETNMEACLIECGFISHDGDNKIFDSRYNEIVEAIGDGILEYCGIKKSNNVPTPPKPSNPTPQPSKEMYRVRKSWSDASSQKGAYGNKDNAITECKKHSGYSVYDSKGNSVYYYKPSAPSPQPTPKPPTVKKATKEWTLRLQKELNKQGFRDKNGRKLVEDGFIGDNTLSAFPVIKSGSRGNITKLVQELLTYLGFSTQGTDGIFGNNSVNATKKYQSSKKISQDGCFGRDCLRKAY